MEGCNNINQVINKLNIQCNSPHRAPELSNHVPVSLLFCLKINSHSDTFYWQGVNRGESLQIFLHLPF